MERVRAVFLRTFDFEGSEGGDFGSEILGKAIFTEGMLAFWKGNRSFLNSSKTYRARLIHERYA